jgi:hypothetical protein
VPGANVNAADSGGCSAFSHAALSFTATRCFSMWPLTHTQVADSPTCTCSPSHRQTAHRRSHSRGTARAGSVLVVVSPAWRFTRTRRRSGQAARQLRGTRYATLYVAPYVTLSATLSVTLMSHFRARWRTSGSAVAGDPVGILSLGLACPDRRNSDCCYPPRSCCEAAGKII